jgi:hypothetical protein
LRRIIDEGLLLIVRRGAVALAALQLFFTAGRCRSFLIAYRPAGNHRKAAWWARSLPHGLADGNLDLRQPADAAALETSLQTLDLSRITG